MGNPGYSLYKGSIIAFTRAMARELGRHNIIVNAICPSLTHPDSPEHIGKFAISRSDSAQALTLITEARARWVKMTPLGRLGKPEDIANVAVFLTSDAASFIARKAIRVIGGHLML